jgi:uncharacterized protein with GYD domain
MARYISLLKFTEKGAKAIKQSTQRAQAFDKAAGKAGVKIEAQYWTLGAYDGVLVLRADSDKKALRCLAELVAGGFVTTETMPAFDQKEFKQMVGG